MNVAAIARNLGAVRSGHNWRCRCPRNCGYTLSLAEGEDGKLLVHCFGGCEYNDILLALVEYGLLDDDGDGADRHDGSDHRVDQRRRCDDAKRIARAQQIYDSGAWDERIRIYLRSRGIDLGSPVLRFSPRAPHRCRGPRPAMLAPVVDVNGTLTCVHMTFLRPDSRGKADLPKELQRETRGPIRGGAIRLAPHDPDMELVIGEGIESTLSAMQVLGRVGWAAAYAANLQTLELPPEVRRIIIAADNDTTGTGQRNALAAYERWTAEGRSVRIKTPPITGKDFNDYLRQGGRL
jgi:putative DNA primase/helicase